MKSRIGLSRQICLSTFAKDACHGTIQIGRPQYRLSGLWACVQKRSKKSGSGTTDRIEVVETKKFLNGDELSIENHVVNGIENLRAYILFWASKVFKGDDEIAEPKGRIGLQVKIRFSR
jgi:hypothetical protein